MTLKSMISDVRIRAADLGADRYPDKLIIEWLNQAYRDLCARLPAELLKSVTTSAIGDLANGTALYSLPASFTQYVNALYDGNHKCLRISQEKRTLVNDNVFYTAATANPYCILWEDQIEFFPTPNTAASYTLYFIAKPTDMASPATDSPSLPEFVHSYLVLYAVARAFQELGNFPQARELINEYEAKIQEIRYLYSPSGPKETGRRDYRTPSAPINPPIT